MTIGCDKRFRKRGQQGYGREEDHAAERQERRAAAQDREQGAETQSREHHDGDQDRTRRRAERPRWPP